MLLAKHAQHGGIDTFSDRAVYRGGRIRPAGAALTLAGTGRSGSPQFVVAATFTVPAVLSRLAAWQWLLEGHRLKGILLYHLIVALASETVILLSWWIRNRAKEERWRSSGGSVADFAGC